MPKMPDQLPGEPPEGTLEMLIDYAFPVDESGARGGGGALIFAAREGREEAALFFLQVMLGKQPNDPPRDALKCIVDHARRQEDTGKARRNPLHFAVRHDCADIAEFIILSGVPVDALVGDGVTALGEAAFLGHVDCMKILLRHGAKVDAPQRKGMTPLHRAARVGRPEAAELLLQHGANPFAKTENGLTPADYANRAAQLKTARLIEKAMKEAVTAARLIDDATGAAEDA